MRPIAVSSRARAVISSRVRRTANAGTFFSGEAGVFLVVVFLVVDVVVVTGFFVEVFLLTAFEEAAFLTGDFDAVTFLTTAFFATVFLGTAFFAGVFFATDFFATVFFTGPLTFEDATFDDFLVAIIPHYTARTSFRPYGMPH